MRIMKFVVAAGLAVTALTASSAAEAQSRHHRGDRYEQRWDRGNHRWDSGRHYGWNRHHRWERRHYNRSCRTYWRHHRRVTVCYR